MFQVYYCVRNWPAEQRGPAECLAGTFRSRYVVLTITVKGSSWVCHPHRDEPWEWVRRRHGCCNGRPPRWVRKAAKLALRRVMEGE